MVGRWPAAMLAVLVLPSALLARAEAGHHRVALVARDGVVLRGAPSAHAHALAVLVQQTQVEILQTGKHFDRVRVWASASGWLPRKDLTNRRPWPSTSTYHAPVVHRPIEPTAPAPIATDATVTAATG